MSVDRRIVSTMRVVVVEDQKKTNSFIRKALQAEGFTVDVCHHGTDALPAVRAIVLDHGNGAAAVVRG